MDLQQKQLMEAFRTDCQTLITNFELSCSTHFQTFCDIWRDMQFSLVFAYHPSEAALLSFCKEALLITKQFFVNAFSLKQRIGALYLLYGIYYKIPQNQFKIRMTLSDWECLMNFHNQVKAKTDEYLDANYILCKLIVYRAFIHCIGDNEYGIEKSFHNSQMKPTLDFNLMPEIKKLAEPRQLLSKIAKMSKAYEERKRDLYDRKQGSSLQLFDANMADDIVKRIHTMQSESRVFTKFESAETSRDSNKQPSSSASTSKDDTQKTQKRMRFRKNLILGKIGRAFEVGLQSQSEDEEEEEIEENVGKVYD